MATPIILLPATYTFACFTDPGWVNLMNPPAGSEKWSWVLHQDLVAACTKMIHEAGVAVSGREASYIFKASDYLDLNRESGGGDLSFTWFIAYEIGQLARKRDRSACPWNDPLLYVPGKWAMRVIKAVGKGIRSVEWTDLGILTPTYWPEFRDKGLPTNVAELTKS